MELATVVAALAIFGSGVVIVHSVYVGLWMALFPLPGYAVWRYLRTSRGGNGGQPS